MSSLKTQQEAMLNLHECSSNMVPFLGNMGDTMNEAFTKLGSLSQRVSFAAGRVQFLQGTFQSKSKNPANCGNILNKIICQLDNVPPTVLLPGL